MGTVDYSAEIAALRSALDLLIQRHGTPCGCTTTQSKHAANEAARIYKNRRSRDALFGDALGGSGEPWWDMLLDLYTATTNGKQISISSAAMASASSPTTALRWIKTLENEGLVNRRADPADGRRAYLELTPHGHDLMEKYLRLGA